MAVRAKFYCGGCEIKKGDFYNSTTQQMDKDIEFAEVQLFPNCCKENESWNQATPSGMVKMTITNPEAYKQFEPGKEYFIDFTPVD